MTDKNAISPAAQRALAEAEDRRRLALEAAATNAKKTDQPRELNGRGGAEPARFGDWEVKGIAVDF